MSETETPSKPSKKLIPPMSGDEFRESITELSATEYQLGVFLGIHERTMARWLKDGPTPVVGALLDLLMSNRASLERARIDINQYRLSVGRSRLIPELPSNEAVWPEYKYPRRKKPTTTERAEDDDTEHCDQPGEYLGHDGRIEDAGDDRGDRDQRLHGGTQPGV